MRRALMLMGIISFILSLLGCQSLPAQQPSPQLSSSEQRKARTEAELEKLGIPINPYLPLVEGEEEARIREPKDVAERAVVLYALVAVADGTDREKIVAWLKEEGLWDGVSPNEKRFLLNNQPTQQEVTNALWRSEALWTLLWALNKTETLSLPTSQCDFQHIQETMPKGGTSSREFIETAQLRSVSEILEEKDRIYRIHWAVRDAQLKEQPVPGGLDPDVVMERHYALNWLTWYANEWDDVTTDT